MPKSVDHDARRRDLADAAIRVIARDGLAGATLALVAEQSGWSIGSIRYYFATKDALLESAVWRVGQRVDARIRSRTGGGMRVADLRTAAAELLFSDGERHEESVVYLAFLAQAAVVPALTAAADDAQRRLQEPLADRIAYAAREGELPVDIDPEHEATRLRVLLDGLRLQLLTAPRHMSEQLASRMLDEHLAELSRTDHSAGAHTEGNGT